MKFHQYEANLSDADMRAHLIAEHDVSEELAKRLGHTGLVFMHVGAHESMDAAR